MRRGLAVSLAGHGLVLLLLVAQALGLWRRQMPVVVEPPSVEVVMGQSGQAREPTPPATPRLPQPAPRPAPSPQPQPPTPQPPAPEAPPPQTAAPPSPPAPSPPPSPADAVQPAVPPPPPDPPRPELPKPEPSKPEPPKPEQPKPEPPKPAPPEPPADVRLGDLAIGATRLDDPSRIVRPAEADKGNLPPLYPPEAERRAQQGTVTLRVHFGPDGLTRRVDVIQSSGYPLLDEAARTALLAWRFRPGLRADGTATDSLEISIDFRLH